MGRRGWYAKNNGNARNQSPQTGSTHTRRAIHGQYRKNGRRPGILRFPGVRLHERHHLFYEGIGNDNNGKTASVAYVTLLDLTGAQAYPRMKVGAIADMQALTTADITATGYMEAEGIKMKNGSLWLGFASRSSDDIRRANIFRY